MTDQGVDHSLDELPYCPCKTMKLEPIPGGIAITRRWQFKFAHGVLGGAGLLLLIAFFISAFTVASNWFFLIWLIVGLCLVYISLTGFFNSTRAAVTKNEIVIEHGPLPWPGKRVLANEVVRLYFRKEKQKSQVNSWFTYAVVAVLQNGKELVLENCDDDSQALFLDFELTHYLSATK
jgi:hypothetical protein